MFGILTKKARQNNKDEVSKRCFDPDYLVERLHRVFFEQTDSESGHIHLYFRNKSDHIIIIWSEGQLRKIAAKSPNSGKGQYIHWIDSEFGDYERQDILRKLHNEIECIKIDMDGFDRTWPSCAEFMKWLEEN